MIEYQQKSKKVIKSRTLTFHKKCLICFNESPLKIMKNTS